MKGIVRQGAGTGVAGRKKSEVAPELGEDMPGVDRKGNELPMLVQYFVQGQAVIDDHVVGGEKGLGDVTAVGPAVNQDLVVPSGKMNAAFMNESFCIHGVTNSQGLKWECLHFPRRLAGKSQVSFPEQVPRQRHSAISV
jgi:hypothetical protein